MAIVKVTDSNFDENIQSVVGFQPKENLAEVLDKHL